MIYELEKVQLYGINWLNYSIIGLILTIILITLTVLWIYKTMFRYSELDEDFTFLICGILMLLTVFCMIVTLVNATSGNYCSNTVPLSKIDNKITVNGEKVVIEDLDDLYDYHDYTKDTGEFGHHRPNKNIRQIFKFEYDEFYESGKLLTENGGYYKLSREDARYLKEKGVR